MTWSVKLNDSQFFNIPQREKKHFSLKKMTKKVANFWIFLGGINMEWLNQRWCKIFFSSGREVFLRSVERGEESDARATAVNAKKTSRQYLLGSKRKVLFDVVNAEQS